MNVFLQHADLIPCSSTLLIRSAIISTLITRYSSNVEKRVSSTMYSLLNETLENNVRNRCSCEMLQYQQIKTTCHPSKYFRKRCGPKTNQMRDAV